MPSHALSLRTLIIALGLLAAASAAADPPHRAWRAGPGAWEQPLFLADNGVNLDSAVSRIRRQTGGRVLSADTVRGDGRTVHEIKVLTDQGHVRRWRVDGDTGEVIRRRQR